MLVCVCLYVCLCMSACRSIRVFVFVRVCVDDTVHVFVLVDATRIELCCYVFLNNVKCITELNVKCITELNCGAMCSFYMYYTCSKYVRMYTM